LEVAQAMIVLDTNAWLFWLHDPRRLSKKAQRAIASATRKGQARLSVISVWEVALKSSIGKLKLPLQFDEWWDKARSYPGISVVSIDSADAISSARLPDSVPRDPADRFIVALALRIGAKLVTLDGRLQRCGVVETIR
jgi:PIN domain nuclease of toxin-antitoxin system